MKAKALPLILLLVLHSIAYSANLGDLYDYNNAEDRYRWYDDVRKHITDNNGLMCNIGTKLYIHKSGKFSVVTIQSVKGGFYTAGYVHPKCLESLENKNFPIPSNSPFDSLILPIRDGRKKPLTKKELDEVIFNFDHQKEERSLPANIKINP